MIMVANELVMGCAQGFGVYKDLVKQPITGKRSTKNMNSFGCSVMNFHVKWAATDTFAKDT